MSFEVFTFQLDQRVITIDLRPYGSSGVSLGVQARLEAAATLANELTVLKARVQARHNYLKAQLARNYDQQQGAAHKALKATEREAFIHHDATYIASREILDFLDAAWELMVRVHCPRLKDAANAARVGESVAGQIRPPQAGGPTGTPFYGGGTQ